jgi:hypothetical protein
VTAPNMAVGEPFNVGLTAASVNGVSGGLAGLPHAGGAIAGVPGGPAGQGASAVAGP